jgi:hypothetical protein
MSGCAVISFATANLITSFANDGKAGSSQLDFLSAMWEGQSVYPLARAFGTLNLLRENSTVAARI